MLQCFDSFFFVTIAVFDTVCCKLVSNASTSMSSLFFCTVNVFIRHIGANVLLVTVA